MDKETYRVHFLKWWEEIGKKQDNLLNSVDTGTYRAHFLKWWNEEGRKKAEKDANPMVTIQKRMDEISNMVRNPKKNSLDLPKEELKDKVENYRKISSSNLLKKRRLKERKPAEKFRHAIRMIRLLVRACLFSKTYLLEERRKSIQIDGDGNTLDNLDSSHPENISQINFKKRTAIKNNLRLEFMVDLITQPQLRNQRSLRRIKWLLSYLKAFKDIISSDMEHELALRVGFEQYEAGRIIARQGKTPERLYYIISGQMDLVREYRLESGLFTKSIGTLKSGMTTDVEEFKHQWLRETSIICKRNVQVLVLHKQDYFFLTSTDSDPPIDFLRTLNFFAEFPFEKLPETSKLIECKYYSQNQVVVTNINTMDWMYIIKSGFCKCIRKQNIIDVKQEIEQSTKKSNQNALDTNAHSVKKLPSLLKLSIMQEKFTAKLSENSRREKCSHKYDKKESGRDFYDLPPLAISEKDSGGKFIQTGNHHEEKRKNESDPQLFRLSTSNFLPLKKVYVAVDLLKSGDIFGLNGISGVSHDASNANVSVVSAKGGAEIIRINKRFFRRNVSLAVLLKLETQHREYIAENEALQYLAEKDNWAYYKKLLMEKSAKKQHEKS